MRSLSRLLAARRPLDRPGDGPLVVPGAQARAGPGAPAAYMTYHVRCWGESDRPAGPGHVTTDMGSLDMTKRSRDLVKRGAAPSTSGSGQLTGPGAVTLARSGAVV